VACDTGNSSDDRQDLAEETENKGASDQETDEGVSNEPVVTTFREDEISERLVDDIRENRPCHGDREK
jgi:hypothetical protein